jgi:hypothetical protein
MEKIIGELKFDYDKSSDVLYSYINKPMKAKTVDINTQKLVGFTVMDFKYRIKNKTINKIPNFEEVNLENILK